MAASSIVMTTYPSLYQINTRVWLEELSRSLGRPTSLDDIPQESLEQLARQGFDWVWFLGVWQTGLAGQQVSRAHPSWRREFEVSLPDLKLEDICGSPFAVQSYTAQRDFGGNAALARLRVRLHQLGLRLLLDFVPNHTALDHPWVAQHPEFYLAGDDDDLRQAPHNFCRIGARVLAHGRDPFFPGWPDTLQLNYRHPGLRAAMRQELLNVADLCDGVRCDMAMLLLPEVFRRTWGERSLPRDGVAPVEEPFWPEALTWIRAHHPDFLFMAEVYWDLEWTLQQQGFDYTYDKRLYDRLHQGDTSAVRGHLHANAEFQRRSVRFLENHDEPRAAEAFPWPIHQAAAVCAFLTPGLRFFHQGQLEGRRRRTSLHLGRRPKETVDVAVQDFYRRLLVCLQRPEVRDGSWRLLDCGPAWEGNATWQQFLGFAWSHTNEGRPTLLVTVNYGPTRGQCYVSLPFSWTRGRSVLLRDLLSPARYERLGDDLAARGLYLDLPEWGHHVFALDG